MPPYMQCQRFICALRRTSNSLMSRPLVELDKDPRMLSNIEGGEASFGDHVKLIWCIRDDAPALPIWTPA